MDFRIDLKGKSASFEVGKGVYSRQAVDIAAHIVAPKADVYLEETAREFELTLESKRKTVNGAELESLAGEFVNELLNEEYRFVVGHFNRKISSLIVTQALLAARGGEHPAEAPAEERTPEFQAQVAAMMKETEAEIRRTMPKKLPPQGTPLPPVQEEAGV